MMSGVSLRPERRDFGHRDQCRGSRPEPLVSAPSGAQPLPAHDGDGHEQEQPGCRQKINHVSEVHHAAGHVLEVSQYGEMRDTLC